jgi:hypothetical protein
MRDLRYIINKLLLWHKLPENLVTWSIVNHFIIISHHSRDYVYSIKDFSRQIFSVMRFSCRLAVWPSEGPLTCLAVEMVSLKEWLVEQLGLHRLSAWPLHVSSPKWQLLYSKTLYMTQDSKITFQNVFVCVCVREREREKEREREREREEGRERKN